MRVLMLLLSVALGCGEPAQKPSAPAPAPAHTKAPDGPDAAFNQDEADVEAVANRFASAILRGDRAVMERLMLTHAQLTSLTNKEIDRAEYDAEVKEFLDERGREAREARAEGPVSVVAKVVDVKTIEPGEKATRRIELAVVKLTVTERGTAHHPALPLLFIKVDGAWRFTLRP